MTLINNNSTNNESIKFLNWSFCYQNHVLYVLMLNILVQYVHEWVIPQYKNSFDFLITNV